MKGCFRGPGLVSSFRSSRVRQCHVSIRVQVMNLWTSRQNAAFGLPLHNLRNRFESLVLRFPRIMPPAKSHRVKMSLGMTSIEGRIALLSIIICVSFPIVVILWKKLALLYYPNGKKCTLWIEYSDRFGLDSRKVIPSGIGISSRLFLKFLQRTVPIPW